MLLWRNQLFHLQVFKTNIFASTRNQKLETRPKLIVKKFQANMLSNKSTIQIIRVAGFLLLVPTLVIAFIFILKLVVQVFEDFDLIVERREGEPVDWYISLCAFLS